MVIDPITIRGGDDIDTALLRAAATNAEQYLRSFGWCLAVSQGHCVDGYGGILALFLFKVDIRDAGSGVWLWVFQGDLPAVYLEASEHRNAYVACQTYLDGLTRWIAAVRGGHNLAGLIPISYAIDDQSLRKLEHKVETVKTDFLPHFATASIERLTKHE